MVDRDRMMVAKNAVANIAAVGLFAVGAAVAFAATAAADPPPPEPVPLPVDPVAPPPPPGPPVPVIGWNLAPQGLGVLEQVGQPANPGALGAPPVVGLDSSTLLGQTAAPSAPGAGPGTPPTLRVF